MDIGHARRPRTLEENERAMRASRELRGLKEQSSVCKREGEIRMRLPFDDNATVKTIIADGQVLHADVEVVALAREIEQSGVPFRRIDSKLMTYDSIASGYRRRAATFHDTVDVDYIEIGHVWRGKPKVRGPVKQSTRVAHCLGACARPHDLPSTTNHQRGSVFKTVGGSSMFRVG